MCAYCASLIGPRIQCINIIKRNIYLNSKNWGCVQVFHIIHGVSLHLLDLGWVSGSWPRILNDSSLHHYVQHECPQLASGFNSCINQQVIYKCRIGRPLPLCPWTGFLRITLDSGSSGWRIACPASLRPYFKANSVQSMTFYQNL